MDKFMQAAIEEARAGLAEGGIPIGSVIAHAGPIIGRGHNRRVQQGSAILHAEMDANPRAAARVFPAQAGINRSAVPVAHRDFMKMGATGPCALGEGHCVLYDVTAVMPAEQQDGLLLCEDPASRYLTATASDLLAHPRRHPRPSGTHHGLSALD
ncbi:MAG: hypothetical protein NHG36_12345 [Chromatiaceae bacterium]|nr:hypothetical protein [Candidatus Thioaporhodococcus sediminis]